MICLSFWSINPAHHGPRAVYTREKLREGEWEMEECRVKTEKKRQRDREVEWVLTQTQRVRGLERAGCERD